MSQNRSNDRPLVTLETIERNVARAHRLRAQAYRRVFGRIWRALGRLIGWRPEEPGSGAHRLQRGRVISLSDGTVRSIKSVEGTLWITPGDASDIVLEAGERFDIVRPDRVIVSPLGAAATAEIVHEPPHALAG